MEIKLVSNSVVILAKNHNPTVLTENFMLQEGFIQKETEIDRSKSAFLPVVSNVFLENGTKITLDPNRLVIQCDGKVQASKLGEAYCKSLPHIIGTAIGLNFVLNVKEAPDFFSRYKQINGFDCTNLTYKNSDSSVRALVKRVDNDIEFDFNFHYELNDIPLNKKEINFETEQNENRKKGNEFIKKLLNE